LILPSLSGSVRICDGLLRGAADVYESLRLGQLLTVIVVFGGLYGLAMGSFVLDGPPRALQMVYSGLKVPLLIVATFALSLPTFFVIMTLSGLRDDFQEAVRALMATQATLTILLASLAPLTLLWYVSSSSYPSALLFNAAMFAVASLSAQRVLRRLYGPLVARDGRHLAMMRGWLVIFAFIGIQMAWILRPFVGDPTEPTGFFRTEAWGNAYEALARIVWSAFGGA
jgi:hypothetical protein